VPPWNLATSCFGQKRTSETLESMKPTDPFLQEDMVHSPSSSSLNEILQAGPSGEPLPAATEKIPFAASRRLTIEDVMNETMLESDYTFKPSPNKSHDPDDAEEIAQPGPFYAQASLVYDYPKGLAFKVCQSCEDQPRGYGSNVSIDL
jgi:hypothetical protein